MTTSISKRIFLNASALKRTACDQAYAYMCVDGLTDIGYVEVLNFGTAVHKFAELCTLHTGDIREDFQTLFAQVMDMYLASGGEDAKLLISTCMSYLDIHDDLPMPFFTGGRFLVENWFEFPFSEQYPNVIRCGTLDRISLINGWIVLYDYKTSRAYDQEEVLENYALSTQMAFYVSSIIKHPEAFSTDERFIAAAKAGKVRIHIVPAFVRVSKTRPIPKWRIGPAVMFSAEQLKQFEDLLESYIEPIIQVNELGYGMRNGWISELCRDCPYKGPCHARTPELRDIIIKESFRKIPYNPKHYV